MASVAIWTAVLNPKVTSVPSMSLSIVFGTPTIGKRIEEADDLVAVLTLPLAHDGPDDRVQTRTVATAGQDSNTHRGEPQGTSADCNRLQRMVRGFPGRPASC